MEFLLDADRELFLAINHLPHMWLTDSVAALFSGIGSWGAIWFVLAVVVFLREETRDHRFFIPFIVSAGAGLFLSEIMLKWVVARPRPMVDMGAIILATPGNYSFPSTHATLAWSMAVVLSAHEPRYRVWFYALAVLISLSRIYLGVHYPIDVLAGVVFGLGIGLIAIRTKYFFH